MIFHIGGANMSQDPMLVHVSHLFLVANDLYKNILKKYNR